MTTSTPTAGIRHYELTNHLGNVSVIVSDKNLLSANQSQKLYLPEVISYQDYYPFGMVMTDRSGSLPNVEYRYGYNGKENDNEVKGESNQQDYGFRVYDPRVGRFLSVDPLTASYPHYTPYQFAGNKPIIAVDLDGCEELIVTKYQWLESGQKVQLSSGIISINNKWEGVRYRDGYLFRGKYYHENPDEKQGTAIMRMRKDNPIYFTALNLYYYQEQLKVNKKVSNGLLFSAGIVTAVGSRGRLNAASEPGQLLPGLLGLFELSSGIIASTAAAAKQYYDNDGEFTKADAIPTSPLGILGLSLDKGFKENHFQTAGDALNGLITFYNSRKDVSPLGILDKSLSIMGFLQTAYNAAGINIDDRTVEQQADTMNKILKDYFKISEVKNK